MHISRNDQRSLRHQFYVIREKGDIETNHSQQFEHRNLHPAKQIADCELNNDNYKI